MTGCTFTGDIATNGSGGAIYSSLGGNGGGVTVTGGMFSGNQASGAGGAISSVFYFGSGAGDTVSISNTTFTSNSASTGGGVYNPGGVTTVLMGCTLSDNSAANGGGIDNNGAGTLVITSSTITGNAAGLSGGGILSNGTLTITLSTISDNDGGGMFIGSSGNTIGGTALGSGNVISGNTGDGIDLVGSLATGNLVEGNYIGTNAAGTAALANTGVGVLITTGATNNTIGGLAATPGAGAGNVISGNTGAGVWINGSGTSGNVVAGNLIGTNLAGTAALPNGGDSVQIESGATNNTIGGIAATPGTGAGNLISGNTRNGVEISGTGTAGNVVAGNLIGTSSAGEGSLGNGYNGVEIDAGAAQNTIGGTVTGARNVISGNSGGPSNYFGVYLAGAGTDYNVILGNYVGTDAAGTVALANAEGGILVDNGASANTIGGNNAADRNLVSGNTLAGIVFASSTVNNIAQGNWVGLNASGTGAIANGTGIAFLNGASAGDAAIDNVISGNQNAGILIGPFGSSLHNSGALVEGNLLGTDPTGTIALGNSGPGVEIGAYSSGNTIGGSAPGTGNLISANLGAGVSISGTTSVGNVVLGNEIGTDLAGTVAMPNSGPGVLITGGATNNTIGGTVAGTGNLISGNTGDGIEISGTGTTGNVVAGNLIGTDVTGTMAVRNGNIGVEIDSAASGNTIGGTASGAGNVIAFNASSGVVVGVGATDPSTGNAIVNDSIHSNTGAGVDNDSSGLLTISSSSIAANSTTGDGGGIDNNGFATLVVVSSTITGNAAGLRGGGIVNYGTMTVTDCTISDNSTYYGGGIWNSGLMTVTDGTISDNSALHGGGGIVNFGPLTVTDSTISNNAAVFAGGIWNGPPGTLIADDCTFDGNHASVGTHANGSGGGGAIYNSRSAGAVGRIELFDCQFTGNYANTTGGAISSTGSGSISGCTFRNNSAGSHGGGGISVYGGALTITNSTVVDNSTSGPGGGIHVHLGTLTADNDTISDNSASSGGGIASDPGTTLTIGNTIVAENTATTSGPDANGTIVSVGNNLIGKTDGSSGWVNSDLTGTIAMPLNPLLSPLGSYGGATQTMALLPGSPAVGAADTRPTTRATTIPQITTDHAAVSDSISPNPDIGAFQTQGSTLVVNSTADGTVSGPGQLTLRQAVDIDNMLSTAEPITFSSLFNTPQTITLTGGELELSNTNGTEAITGAGADLLTISGGGTQGVFRIDAGVTASLADLTVADGVAADGGGVYSVGNLTVTGDVFIGNTATASGPYGYPAARSDEINSVNGHTR